MLKQSGTFKYKDYYGDIDIINITVTGINNLNMSIYTHDKVYKKAEYNFKRDDLIAFINCIKKAWVYERSTKVSRSRKDIEVIIEEPKNIIMERNIQMTVKINNKCIFYGFDLHTSRRLHQMFAQIINNKKSTILS